MNILRYFRNNIFSISGLLHASALFIISGALVTYFFGISGQINLRLGQESASFIDTESKEEAHLPFKVRLDELETINHPGGGYAADYRAKLTFMDKNKISEAEIRLNKIAKYRFYRFYLNKMQEGEGANLIINRDPIGILLVYTGFILFSVCAIVGLFRKKGIMRSNLEKLQKSGLAVIIFLLSLNAQANPAGSQNNDTTASVNQEKTERNIDKDVAKELSSLTLMYKGRLCPASSVARDFASTIKDRNIRREYSDEQLFWHLILNFPESSGLAKFFPVKDGGSVVWVSPAETLPASLDNTDKLFITNILPLIKENIGDREKVSGYIRKIKAYQRFVAPDEILPDSKVKAEQFYLAFISPKELYIIALTLFVLAIAIGIVSRKLSVIRKTGQIYWYILLILGTALLASICLRGYILGRAPLASGYETMTLISLFVCILALALGRVVSFMSIAGMGIFALTCFISTTSKMDPSLNHVQPILSSPLISIHVSAIILSYSLLALSCIIGISAIILYHIDKNEQRTSNLRNLSLVLLHPAIVFIGIGIILGSVWANISWGNYWSWDPKETWALITMLIYAIPLHYKIIPMLRKPLHWHYYIALAIISVAITYWGVGYWFGSGSMHSYQ